MQSTADFDPKATAKKLTREARSSALATLMANTGDPYCSLVNVATATDGTPLLLISRLAVHTKNILADPRVSLMQNLAKIDWVMPTAIWAMALSVSCTGPPSPMFSPAEVQCTPAAVSRLPSAASPGHW